MEPIICQICNESKPTHRHLTSHLQKHKISLNEYNKKFNIKLPHSICKVCGKEIELKRKYCSNKCKFSDKELNKLRSIKTYNIDTSKQLKCKYCEHITNDVNNFAGYAQLHLLNKHNITVEYLMHYDIIDKPVLPTFKCPLCEWTTVDLENKSGWLTTHLKKSHNLSPSEFVVKFPLYKKLWTIYFKKKERELFILENSRNRIRCEICNLYFKKLSNSHLLTHNITPLQYKEKFGIFKTTSDQTSYVQSQITSKHNLLHGTSFAKNHKSSYEDEFRDTLQKCNIGFVSPFLYHGKLYDIFVPSINAVIEIDGTGHHKNVLEYLTLQTINGSCNDKSKTDIMRTSIFNFYRIRYNKDTFLFSDINELDIELKKNIYIPDYSITWKQIISSKEYFTRYISVKGKEKLRKYASLLLKFIRTFHPPFPYPSLEENIQGITTQIQTTDYSSILENKTFISKRCHSVGHNYLKHHFKSYWNSAFGNNKTPIEAWNDDDIMRKVIEYRIGCNASGEVFDFSLHQLIRGLSARRYTISFFKPVLAAAIYKHFLGENQTPTVIDPCTGFGGRMLGFKSMYPRGRYIGIEPNPDTFKELQELAKNFTNVELHNCKLEDYSGNKECDLTFTSIPYFDTERYSNVIHYDSFEQWQDTFIKSLMTFENLLVNIPNELRTIFSDKCNEYFIKNGTSHFNNKHHDKLEYLLKIS